MELTLKAARVNVGYTQRQVAEKLGISRDTIGNWEKGKTFPNAAQIRSLEALYKVDCSQIIFLPNNTLKA